MMNNDGREIVFPHTALCINPSRLLSPHYRRSLRFAFLPMRLERICCSASRAQPARERLFGLRARPRLKICSRGKLD